MSIKIISDVNYNLASNIADYFGLKVINPVLLRFNNSEIEISLDLDLHKKDINKNCSNADIDLNNANDLEDPVIIIQEFSSNINDQIFQLLLKINSLIRSQYKNIIIVTPYLPYSRQNKLNNSSNNKIISSYAIDLIAKQINLHNINALITVDLHSTNNESLFNNMHNLNISSIMFELIGNILKTNNFDQTIIVSPDAGSADRAKNIASLMGLKYLILDKNRDKNNSVFIENFDFLNSEINTKDISNKHCIIIDDIIDSGNTLCNAARYLRYFSPSKITSFITHFIPSDQLIDKLNNDNNLDEIYVSNSFNIDSSKLDQSKIKIFDIGLLIAKYIDYKIVN